MTPIQKINRLLPLIEQATEQQQKVSKDAGFAIWHDRLVSTLIAVFGPEAQQVKKMEALTFTYKRRVRIAGADYSIADRELRITRFKRDLEVCVGLLNRLVPQ